jgi:hypothetical protein
MDRTRHILPLRAPSADKDIADTQKAQMNRKPNLLPLPLALDILDTIGFDD